MPLNLHLFDIDLTMWVTERKTIQVKCHSLPLIIKGTCCHLDLSLWMLTLIIWLRWPWLLQLSIRVLHCQLLTSLQPPQLSILYCLEGVTVCSPHLGSVMLCSSPLKAECLHRLSSSCAWEKSLLSHLLLISSFIYIRVDMWILVLPFQL